MSLRDGQGLILAVKAFGERDALVELLCAERGRVRGLVKGGKGTRGGIAAILQPFNGVGYEHFRRLDGQLGTLTVELTKSRAHVWLGAGAGAYGVPYLSELLAGLLPEEHPYAGLHGRVIKLMESGFGWQDMVAFELWLLDAVGYGLRLRPDEAVECAEGSMLAYVSPVSGRAVPEKVARGWESRLLPLPYCMGGPECGEVDDYAMAWRLTGHFIEKALHGGILASRARLGHYYGKQVEQKTEQNVEQQGDDENVGMAA